MIHEDQSSDRRRCGSTDPGKISAEPATHRGFCLSCSPSNLRKIGVNFFCWVVYYSGLLWFLSKVILPFLKPRAAILYYHRVRDRQGRHGSDVKQTPFEAGVSQAVFAKQMRLLARAYRVMNLETLVTYLRSGRPLPRDTVCITFDDGYLDNYQSAFPILKRYGLPATIFVVSGGVETGDWLWWDKLSSLLKHLLQVKPAWDRSEPGLLPESVHGALESLWRMPLAARGRAIEHVVRLFKELPPPVREQAFLRLEKLAGKGALEHRAAYSLVTWEQLQEMALHGVSVGAHTVSHPLLSQLDLHAASREIADSKVQIEQRLGRPVTLFAYPSGDFTPPTKALVREAGFVAACATVQGRVDATVDLYELQRIGITEQTFENVFGRFSRSIFHVKMCRLFDRIALH